MVHYVYANAEKLHVFDTQLQLVEIRDLSPEDSLAISQHTISSAEKSILQTYSPIKFCNYKIDSHDNVRDLSVISQILQQVEQSFTQTKKNAYKIVSHELQKAVTWDLHVCQAMRTSEELTHTINLLAKRLREWFEWQLPEFSKKIDSHEYFIQEVSKLQRADLVQKVQLFEDISLGIEFSQKDQEQLQSFARSIYTLIQEQESLRAFIEEKMTANAPHFTRIAGAQIGAKLLSTAGNFTRLVKMTSSTIQVLGAEKALFRHLKTGAKPPKYGILFQHKLVSQAKFAIRGKVARMLANAISLAVKADYFQSTDFDSNTLYEKIERM
ncbi:MAG: hypothetical protein ACMXYA_01405 [Candidatus Woesearchaeota archaeon]